MEEGLRILCHISASLLSLRASPLDCSEEAGPGAGGEFDGGEVARASRVLAMVAQSTPDILHALAAHPLHVGVQVFERESPRGREGESVMCVFLCLCKHRSPHARVRM